MRELLTKQEIFDKVAKHLLKQKIRSINPRLGVCAYRSHFRGKKLMCAAGCLIRDSSYNKLMEYKNPLHVLVKNALYESGAVHLELIVDLQKVHDNALSGDLYGDCSDNFKAGLVVVAANYGLLLDPSLFGN